MLARLLLALAAIVAAPAVAQSPTWTQCAVESGTCDLGAGVRKLVRYGQPWTPAWTAPREVVGSIACDNATWGDPSPGTGKRCEFSDAPAPPVATIPWVITWEHATKNTDGSDLVDRTGYRIESTADPNSMPAPLWKWETVASVGPDIRAASVALPAGKRKFRGVTLASSGESLPSNVIEAIRPRGTVPQPPTDVGVAGEALALVSGASTGLRAVFARTSTGSRGAKIGDLTVGPTTQGAAVFDRVKCSTTDRFMFGATRYARVIDVRAPTQYRAGYVSGCVDYGKQ